jgi:uracil-DNA glycosylase
VPVNSKVMLIGQAPGDREGELGKPFAWTAGKTLFKWFSSIGLDEEKFRQKIYIAAVCRCFPGKKPKGGDRVPSKEEIAQCRPWLEDEFELMKPALIVPVGKLAISQFIEVDKLVDVIGQSFKKEIKGRSVEVIPLPHPSGASTWHQRPPGKDLLERALKLIEQHGEWKSLL